MLPNLTAACNRGDLSHHHPRPGSALLQPAELPMQAADLLVHDSHANPAQGSPWQRQARRVLAFSVQPLGLLAELGMFHAKRKQPLLQHLRERLPRCRRLLRLIFWRSSLHLPRLGILAGLGCLWACGSCTCEGQLHRMQQTGGRCHLDRQCSIGQELAEPKLSWAQTRPCSQLCCLRAGAHRSCSDAWRLTCLAWPFEVRGC